MSSHRPGERASWEYLAEILEAYQSQGPSVAQTAMTHQQALRIHRSALWLAQYASEVAIKTAKQSGKSASRKGVILGPGAI